MARLTFVAIFTVFIISSIVDAQSDSLKPGDAIARVDHLYNHLNPCVTMDDQCKHVNRVHNVCGKRCFENTPDVSTQEVPSTMCDCDRPFSHLNKQHTIWQTATNLGFIIPVKKSTIVYLE